MHNLFGTDGLRGRAGSGLLVQDTLIQLGKSIAAWACAKYGAQPRILIAQDTRISSGFVKAALKTGLLQYPLVLEDAAILPTPALMHSMQLRNNIHCALMISASHNAYEDNGIKIIDAHTGKISEHDELLISQGITHAAVAPGNAYGVDILAPHIEEIYCQHIINLFPANFLHGKKIVLDTAHGATYTVAPYIFKQLGAEVITLHNTPDGYNINQACGALFPAAAAKAIATYTADIGFCFDGDGDRIVAINKIGEIKDGDDILHLLLAHPTYAHCDAIVGTVMTNEGFVNILNKQDKQLIRTAVGDKHVAAQLADKALLLGGEPSGHIILNDIVGTGDGILVALRLLETLIITGNWHMHTFERFPQAMVNVRVSSKKDLEQSPLKEIITATHNNLTNGRILVRYSGTENVLRVMVEAPSYRTAHDTCQQLADQLSKAL